MAEIIPVVNTDNSARLGDVIFVHGVGGDAFGTWQPRQKDAEFWPAWLGEDHPDVAVWTLSYEAAISRWQGAASPIIDLASEVLAVCESQGIGRLPLVFIAHSLGGLVVKQMLRNAVSYGSPAWRELHDNTRAIVFLSTPHAGADLASWFTYLSRILRTNVTVREMESHSAQLRDLNLWFRAHAASSGMRLQVYYESRSTAGVTVVNATSGDPGIPGVAPVPLDADHGTICKLEDRTQLLYPLLDRLVMDTLQRPADRADHGPAETATSQSALRVYLVSDLRGYTSYTVEHGDEAAVSLASEFEKLARDIVNRHGGRVFGTAGDQILAAFGSARQAALAALELRHEVSGETLPLKAGIGLDVGEALAVGEDFRGGAVNLAARLCSLAGGGEVLASEAVMHLAGRTPGAQFFERGKAELKGFADPVRVVGVLPEGEDAPTHAEEQAAEAEEPSAALEETLPIGGYLGSLPSRPLVARDHELGTLINATETVVRGAGLTVMVTGEGGVGKTRLAQELSLQLREQGFLIATGRCYEPRRSVPYFPFLEALDLLFRRASAASRAAVSERWPYLMRLLPEQRAPTSATSSNGGAAGGEDQEHMFRSVSGFITNVAEQQPVAVMLDDLQWSDTTTIELVQHLARFTKPSRVLLFGTYRDVEVQRDHPLGRAIRDLQREQLVERVAIRRLEQSGTEALIATEMGEAQVSDEFVQLVQSHTDGNPFFTVEVLRALVERGDIYREDDRWERLDIDQIVVPDSVRDVVGERLGRLGEKTQELLTEASVLGQTFGFEALEGLSDAEEDDIEAALEEAAEAGIVRELDGDTFTFDHALTQQSLYAGLSGRRRRRLHLAAAEVLLKLPTARGGRRPAELAWHFLKGEDAEHALEYSMLAGAEADGLYAHADAQMHYRNAVQAAEELEDRSGLRRALERLGMALRAGARYSEALQMLERALAMAGNDDEALGTMAEMSVVQQSTGATDDFIHRLRGRLEAAEADLQGGQEGASSSAIARAYASLGRLQWSTGRYADTLTALDSASEYARLAGDERTLAEVELGRGTVLHELGRQGEGQTALEEALKLGEHAGQLGIVQWAANNLSYQALLCGELGVAQRYAEQVVEVLERRKDPAEIVYSIGAMAEILILRGAWSEARTRLNRAIELSKGLDKSYHVGYPLAMLGWLDVLQGRWEEGEGRLAQAASIASDCNDIPSALVYLRMQMEMELLRGRPAEAMQMLESCAVAEEARGLDGIPLLLKQGQALVALGDTGRADPLVTGYLEQCREKGWRALEAEGLVAEGEIRRLQDRPTEARTALQAAVEMVQSMPYPLAEGRALYQLSLLGPDSGSDVDPSTALDKARVIFEHLECRPYLDKIEAEQLVRA